MENFTKFLDKEYRKLFFKAALIRAVKTVAQTLAGAVPAGLAITPTMIKEADWSILLVVVAWLGTGLVAGAFSILTSVAVGLPEVDDMYEKLIYKETK